ncbi:MAG TPA: hypothetical protein VK970_14760 [Candidatus Methylacidiphilales bacterium]|nr:hypothetical protein [Candidatus Methylacidiphilales bacterium]
MPSRCFLPSRFSNFRAAAAAAAVATFTLAAVPAGFAPAYAAEAPGPIKLTDEQAQTIGKQIWKNECAGTVEGLTSWNKGEFFPSLGIGHFIWYPKGVTGPFQESFPGLISFLRADGVKIPGWLSAPQEGCPWPNRAAFMADIDSAKMKELRKMLASTVAQQARYAAKRSQLALPAMTAGLSPAARAHVEQQFRYVASHPKGVYALVDYVNFKGEGVKETERYNGQGWGLLQILESMDAKGPGASAVTAFADGAAGVLKRRVSNKPAEKMWLPGWLNRVNTYRP